MSNNPMGDDSIQLRYRFLEFILGLYSNGSQLAVEEIEKILPVDLLQNTEFLVHMLEKGNEAMLASEIHELKRDLSNIQAKLNRYEEILSITENARTKVNDGHLAKALSLAAHATSLFVRLTPEGMQLVLKNLKLGRSKGTAVRIEESKKQHELIKKSLDDLYKHGQGWKWSYPQISEYLKKNKLSNYEDSQTLKLVKKYAPEIKEKYRQK